MSTKVTLITLIGGGAAFLVTPMIWRGPGEFQLTSAQVPFFMFIAVLESLLFGFGIAMLVVGTPLVRQFLQTPEGSRHHQLTIFAFISILWMAVSWWPHDNFHRIIGMSNMWALLHIEYGFHVSLIIATVILTVYCYSMVKEKLGKS